MRVALHAAGLALALWLAGCASSPTTITPEAPPAPTAAAPKAPPPVAVTPIPAPPQPSVIPSGPLTPIMAADAFNRSVATTQAPADLWDRIRRGYAMPNLQDGLVGKHEQWYSSRPDYMQRMTDRSRKYLFHIVEELERRNMPSELALLPFIESAFNPQAVSSARAAGMWQFMPATGRHYDLKQNFFRDDRRDVLASTRAALDYLQRLHGMFGDWHLALAAYNWGEGSVGRAIAANKRKGKGTAYTDLKMPDETRNYVPKLQAVKNIVASPEQFRAELPVIENHPYFDMVTVTRDIDIALAAKLADIELEDFKALNPQINRPVILAAGTPQILLPWENAKVFTRNLADYNQGRFASWTAWTVPGTMSVAEAAKRVGWNEGELRSVNTIPPRMLIKSGSVLVVPRAPGKKEDVASHLADNGQLSLSPERSVRRTTIKAGRNDSVASIAKRYRVSASQVAEWNGLAATSVLKAGQSVILFVPSQARTSNVQAKPRAKAVVKQSKRR